MIKVRFAPSPTGFLHIGGARTALFNWMYAKVQNGKFILRIEDTDQERSKQEYTDEILKSMRWLGMDWDELYFQSKRFDLYTQYARTLLEEGKAYREEGAIILKMPPQEIKIDDVIRGEIIFDTSIIKDQVLIKSDGSPAYNFSCVIDDALMEISCVIRGEDHISNTPKQIIIYQALGFKQPKFAHLPLIMGEDGARLSKRTQAVAVSDYKKEGFLPQALVNYLMLLGWSPGNNQEIVSLDNAVKKFSIKKINKTSAIFSMDKLRWVNSQYIRQLDTEKLIELLTPFLEERGFKIEDVGRERFKNVVNLYKGRMVTLRDFLDWAEFIFVDQVNIDEAARKEHLSLNKGKEFHLLKERFSTINPFDAPTAEKTFRQLVDDLGLKTSDLVHPVRVALTGRSVGPSLFETIAVLGKEKTMKRLEEAFRS